MHYSTKSKTLALLPKCTGFLSLVGSAFIFQDVVFHKKPIHRVYHRLVLGLSVSDMVASVVNILSTWPIPEGTEGVYLASGTTQTCTAQGFFNELGNLATPLYNASLCCYYVLVIRNSWVEEKIRRKAEPLMHFIPLATASTIAIIGLPLDLYNSSGWLCWIATYECSSDGTCERGQHANIFRWLHYAIIWSSIISVTLGMYSIYRNVRHQEHIQSQEMDADVVRRGQKSKKVAIQAALFVGALYLTWIFTTITRIYNIRTGNNNFVLLVLMATFFPLQGFFNCLIYLRPRYLRSRSRNPNAPVRRLVLLSLYHESHPIHGLTPSQQPGGRQGESDEERRRGRSSTASFYSMGNSKLRQNSGEDAVDYSDVNTVAAIASVSDYNQIEEASTPPTDDRPTQDARATLDAVEEASVGSDQPVAEQEMVEQENGTTID